MTIATKIKPHRGTKKLFGKWLNRSLGITTLALAIPAQSFAAISVDGNVQGLSEGYTSEFDITFDIENGPTGFTGGKLFTAEMGSMFWVGLILPPTIVDNTYGDNKATDWGTKDHFLRGGGDGLDGSDKWEIKPSSGDFELKLDYIEEDSSGFNTRLERFKVNGADSTNIEHASSLDYNYNILGLTQFFGNDADSPEVNGAAPTGSPIDYSFDSPAAAWIPEIMYEFKINEPGLTLATFMSGVGGSIIHASPNKLGGNKVYINPPTVTPPSSNVPEPGTLILLAAGLVGVGVGRRRKHS